MATNGPAPRAPFVLTIDVGTSSARCSLYDASARPVPGIAARRAHQVATSPDGGAELGPEALIASVIALVDETMSRAGELARDVVCVAPGGFLHTLVGLDDEGRAITPVHLWMDARSDQDAAQLRRELDEREVHARTGCMLHWSYLPAKLRWMRRTDPARFARIARFVSFPDHLVAQLLGASPTSISLAAASGLFDQHRLDWDDEMLRATGITRAQLLEVARDDRRLMPARDAVARRWPALAQVPWLVAQGDAALSSIGAGCATRERAALMVGTSVALRVLFRARDVVIPEGVWGYRADETRMLLGGALNDGGSLVAWLDRTLRLPDHDALEAQLAASSSPDERLLVLPLWAGERSPGWAGRAHGAIVGLALHASAIDLYRAALEGIALRCAELDTRLRDAVPEVREVVATGAALLASPAWQRIVASALGRPLVVSDEREASSRGAALVALDRLGIAPGVIDGIAPSGPVIAPDPERHARYRVLGERQRALYRALVDRDERGGS
ncbi:gluconokinase [Sandaracinus amylolyticus]|uniref:gluconokinase n=1 Tax=Sandaracinus amylolyticus TaxID=927083 RepID=UPI001F162B02|nr:gluconokinase [Sandaracinus amylolyticus]